MNPVCPYCASEMESEDNSVEGTVRITPATRFFYVCKSLDCRAQSPHMRSRESAALAAIIPPQ